MKNKPLIKQVLLLAADIAAILDHHKGDFFKYASTIDGDHIVGCCALGAISMAEREVGCSYNSVAVFRKKGRDLVPADEEFCGVGDWNDQPHITKEDVVNELRKCAEKLD